MTIVRIARILLPIVAISASLGVTAIFSLGVHFFLTLQITLVAGTTFSGLIVFLVGWILVVGVSLYCTIVYDKLHRMFLLIVIVSGCLGLGILSYVMLGIADVLFDCVQTLWRDSEEKAVENLQRLFECEGFKLTPAGNSEDQTCADVIQSYLNRTTRQLGTAFGISALVYLLLGSGCVYITCKLKDEPDEQKKLAGFRESGSGRGLHLADGLNPGGVDDL
jgi:hypothetical protein